MSTMPHPESIYSFNLLNAATNSSRSDWDCLTSRLLVTGQRIRSGLIEMEDVATNLASDFSILAPRLSIDRVCLSISPTLSRRLTVMSDWNDKEIHLSEVKKGYSCYVAPRSSLLLTSRLVHETPKIRVYSDIQQVLNAFRSSSQPIQKTIAHLAAAGIKSGLAMCVDLGFGGTAHLFLNSRSVGEFDQFQDEPSTVLHAIQLVLESAIISNSIKTISIDPNLYATAERLFVPNVLSAIHLQSACTVALHERFASSVEVAVFDLLPFPIFFPCQTALLLTLLVLDSYNSSATLGRFDIFMEIHAHDNTASLDFDLGDDVRSRIPHRETFLTRIAGMLGLQLCFEPYGFSISANCDPANAIETQCGYSVLAPESIAPQGTSSI